LRTSFPTATTSRALEFVVIDYDEMECLFVSRQERLPFSAEKLLCMIHWRAQQMQVSTTPLGCLVIRVGTIYCQVSHRAVERLMHCYQHTRAYQISFPRCGQFFQVT
jgi:hypothetical protein